MDKKPEKGGLCFNNKMYFFIIADVLPTREYIASVVRRTLVEAKLFVADNGLTALDVIENQEID